MDDGRSAAIPTPTWNLPHIYVKPSNYIFETVERRVLKLIDFGLSVRITEGGIIRRTQGEHLDSVPQKSPIVPTTGETFLLGGTAFYSTAADVYSIATSIGMMWTTHTPSEDLVLEVPA